MEPARSIGHLGFTRWYERRLIEAHAWLVTGLFSTVAIAACMEELTYRGSLLHQFVYVVAIGGMGITGLYGLTRYQRLLAEAERVGEHATCGSCGAYGRFKLISDCHVRCRKCNNEWRLIHPE